VGEGKGNEDRRPDDDPTIAPGTRAGSTGAGRRKVRSVPHQVWRGVWRALALLVILTGFSLGALRLALPRVETYRAELSDWLGDVLGQQVSVGRIEASWRGWSPVLRLEDVRVMAPGSESQTTGIRFAYALLAVDAVASLRAVELRAREIVVNGASLIVSRTPAGALSIRGLERGVTRAPGGPQDLARWLLRPRTLRLDEARLFLADGRGGEATAITNVNLEIRNSGQRHWIQASGVFENDPMARLGFAMDVTGDLLSPSWSGEVFVRGDALPVSAMAGLLEGAGVSRPEGRVGAELRSRWRFGRLVEAAGRFETTDLVLGLAHGTFRAPRLAADLVARGDGAGLDLRLEQIDLVTAGEAWPTREASLRLEGATDADGPRLLARVDTVRLEDALALVGTLADRQVMPWKAFHAAEPTGLLHDIEVEVPEGSEPRLHARFAGLAARAQPPIPGFAGLDGTLEVQGLDGAVSLVGGAVEAGLPQLFDAPLQGRDLEGQIAWSRDPEGWLVAASNLRLRNDDFRAGLNGTVRWPQDGTAPEASLVVAIEDGNLARLPHYLPTRLPARLAGWLEHALRSARLSRGELLLHGPLDQLPFDDGHGRFVARGRVALERLDYSRAWPGIDDVDVEFTLDGRRARFQIHQGTILGSRIDEAEVEIPDVTSKPAVVQIVGRVSGRTEHAARFLAESPLAPRFRTLLGYVSVEGESSLELDLKIPLKSGGRRTVAGTLSVRDNQVGLPILAKGAEAVTGAFRFDATSAHAEDVSATYLGREIALDAEPMESARGTRLTVRGRADRGALARHLHNAGLLGHADADASPILARVHGEAAWRAEVELPKTGQAGDTLARLRVSSDLAGVDLELPAPLGKSAEEAVRVEVESIFRKSGARDITVHHGDQARARFRLDPPAGLLRPMRGLVLFGPGEMHLPEPEGLVVRGHLPFVSVSAWHGLARGRHPHGEQPVPEQADSLLKGLRSVEITMDELDLLGSRFERARIEASAEPDGAWNASLIGPALLGHLTVAPDPGKDGVTVDFEHLSIPARDAPAGLVNPNLPDPGRLPPFRFSCRSCRYAGLELGAVKLAARPREEGLDIENIYVLTDGFEARAHGRWTRTHGVHNSTIVAEVYGDDLGRLLSTLGYEAKTTTGGATDILLRARWPGAPMDFDLRRIEGVLHFRASEGRLLAIESGATGRVFGLLMLPALPRRLVLDFSDLFERGFGYESMEGSFAVEDGHAYTNNLRVESGTARIEVAGRTGLADEDYDQVVTVTPKLSSSLPLAAIWLAEKLLNQQVFDKAFAYRYTVTGTWNDPVVERIIEPLPEPDEDRR
jgi:uncharacterized protein (TIGR02099 family)